MNTENSRTFLHRTFIVITIVGLILNLAFDLSAFRKNEESDLTGQRVSNSFQALIHLERLTHLLASADFKSTDPHVQLEIDKITEFKSETLKPETLASLKIAMTENPKKAVEMIESLRENIIEEVAKHQADDTAIESEVQSSMMRALIGDLGLVAIMLLLFVLNMQAKRKAEQNLKISLMNMRESLMNLEEKSFGRKMASKMTVHDLKNPIGTIMGFAQLMYDDPKSELSVAEFSDRIRKISERSLVLVESLLHENDSDEMVRQKVDLVSIVNDISSQLEIQASRKSQKIIGDVKVSKALVMGNALKLEEVVSNILGNAIKYSPAESKIKIAVYEDNRFVKLEVEDQGPGFTEQDKKNAFQFGKKLSATPTNNESSTGYGLYIVKQIVETFHGEVAILDSTSGSGARIQVKLPKYTAKNPELEV